MMLPADLADAKNLTVEAGNFRSTSSVCITLPTMPVAPTIPRDNFFATHLGYLSDQPPVTWINSICRDHPYAIFASRQDSKSSLF